MRKKKEIKELTPIEALNSLKQNYKSETHLFDDELIDIIEKGFKDLVKENRKLKRQITYLKRILRK